MGIHAAAIVYFNAVRRAGSIREAARQLNIASSAVNRQILKLEAEIGVPLFERFASGTRLTSAGEALARHVLVVMQDLERARTDIDSLKGARAGHVAIAAVEGVASALLPAVIGALRKRAPRVTASVNMLGSFAIPRAVLEGEADVGLAFSLPRRPDLRQVALARFKLGAVLPPNHPLSACDKIGLAACLDYPLIMPMGDLSIGRLLAPILASVPREIPVVVRSSSIELMRELVEHNAGIAFQTRIGLERPIRENRLVHVPLEAEGPIWSDLGVYVRAGRALPATLDLLLAILIEEIYHRETEERNT